MSPKRIENSVTKNLEPLILNNTEFTTNFPSTSSTSPRIRNNIFLKKKGNKSSRQKLSMNGTNGLSSIKEISRNGQSSDFRDQKFPHKFSNHNLELIKSVDLSSFRLPELNQFGDEFKAVSISHFTIEEIVQ